MIKAALRKPETQEIVVEEVFPHAPSSISAGEAENEPVDPRNAWAEGATALMALALLRLKQSGKPRPRQLPQGLPLETLSALRPHLVALNNLGCRPLGDVRALPRSGVARRLGAECLLALDQLWGERACSMRWIARRA